MWVQSLFVFVSVISIIEAIKIPIENSSVDNPEIVPSASTSAETFQARPIYYASSEDSSDSYLIPPDPHKHAEVHHEVPTPATYLLPPSPDAQNGYFVIPTEPGEQTDWYPVSDITQTQEQNIVNGQHHEDKENPRTGKTLNRGPELSMPTRNLLPPRENAPNDFIVVSPSVELELPLEEIDHTIMNPSPDVHILREPPPRLFINQENMPVHRIPKYYGQKYKNPTGLYPKKYVGEFKPILIPISQYGDGLKDEVPVARPVKLINPEDIKQGYTPPNIHNINNSFDKTNKVKKYNEAPKLAPETDETYRDETRTPSEQDTSETNFRHPTRDAYPVPAKTQTQNPFMSDGKRTEFRMHGLKGPHSYQFGYDTGKGKNRQFRYEERDNDGHVRGHYGYMDRGGKLRVVNYDADPVHGFRAEAPVEKDVE